MESIASILLVGSLINRLIQKGILSQDDRRIIFAESLSVIAEIEAATTEPTQLALLGRTADYLRHFGGEESPQS